FQQELKYLIANILLNPFELFKITWVKHNKSTVIDYQITNLFYIISMRISRALVLFLSILCSNVYAQKNVYTLYSPDKHLEIKVEQEKDGRFSYRLASRKKTLIANSPIGFETVNGKMPSAGWQITKTDRKKVKAVWKP